MRDQFAFRPTGSTTAALIELMHLLYSMFDQGNDYVRCILIDYSKAFDVVNHEILLTELSDLGLNNSIFSWIANFLTGRSQSVKMGDVKSAFLLITRSIVQGSGLGPYLYILLARRLKTLSLMNRLVKYADDTTLVVPQRTDCPIEVELQNIVDWSLLNKLTINKSKTKEIIFWKSGKVSKNLNIPTIPQIERVQQVRLLGVLLSSNLSFTPHIDYVLAVASQRFYLLNQLKKMSLATSGLNSVFSALIGSRILYALPAFYGFILQSDVDRIDAMFRKAKRWGITTDEFNMDFLSTLSDSRLFKNIKFDQHCLHHLLPQVHEVPSYNLRGRPTSYEIPRAKISKLLNSFIYRCANLNY